MLARSWEGGISVFFFISFGWAFVMIYRQSSLIERSSLSFVVLTRARSLPLLFFFGFFCFISTGLVVCFLWFFYDTLEPFRFHPSLFFLFLSIY